MLFNDDEMKDLGCLSGGVELHSCNTLVLELGAAYSYHFYIRLKYCGAFGI